MYPSGEDQQRSDSPATGSHGIRSSGYPERMPAGVMAAEGDQPACERCGARLSVTYQGTFWPCGHDPRTTKPMAQVWTQPDGFAGKRPEAVHAPGQIPEPCQLEQGRPERECVRCSAGPCPDRARFAEHRVKRSLFNPMRDGYAHTQGLPTTSASDVQAPPPRKADPPSPPSTPKSEPEKPVSPPTRARNGAKDTPPDPVGAAVKGALEKIGTTPQHSARLLALAEADPTGESVSVTWAKELFTPQRFHTIEVGPFVASGPVRPGESRAEAAMRLNEDLRAFAEKERDRKIASYLKALKGLPRSVD